MMTNRERILAVLRGEQPDRVPWFGDLSYWHHAQTTRGTMPDRYQGDGYYSLHRELGVGFYLQGFYPFQPVYDGVEFQTSTNSHTSLTRLVTPVGTLTATAQYLPESYCWGITEHLVKTADDLAVFCYMLEHTRYVPDYQEAERRYSLVGDNGVVLCYLPHSPLMELITNYMGIEATVMIRVEEPERFAEAMDLLTTRFDEAAALAVESPAECLMIPENLSSEVVGKRLFEEYMRPFEERWNRAIHKAGKYSFVHMDGTLQGLVTEVASTGFNVLEALTPAPVGDIELGDIRLRVEAETIIWGGLPGLYFTPLVSDEEFERFVREILTVMSQKPGYVLGVADQVPPGGTWERIARVNQLVEQWGGIVR